MSQTLNFEQLRNLKHALAARGVTGLSVFGSRARGDAHEDSDLDIIIDYDPKSRFSLIDLAAVARIVEEKTGLKADVMTRPGLHPILKDDIEASSIKVF